MALCRFRCNTFKPDVLERISHSLDGYLADGRLSYLRHDGERSDQRFYRSLTYDDRGRLEHLSTSRAEVASVARSCSYDDLNQLTQVENGGSDQEFDYDAADNRRGETEPYNRVRNEGLSGFDNDAKGSVTGHWRCQPEVSVSLTSANTADSAPHDFLLDLHRVSVPGGLTLSGVGDTANIVVTVSLVGTTASHSLAGSVVCTACRLPLEPEPVKFDPEFVTLCLHEDTSMICRNWGLATCASWLAPRAPNPNSQPGQGTGPKRKNHRREGGKTPHSLAIRANGAACRARGTAARP